jgi:hypothetical protein
MRSLASVLFLSTVFAMGFATGALADDNDLVLSRLGQITPSGTAVVSLNQDFRSLSSELGVLIAPRFLSPSDTLGYSGFQYSVEGSYTSINNNASYWCATEESSGCTPKKTGWIPTFSIMARKGIWLPIPSFEIGGGFVHILNSGMWAAQVYGKFGLHEGFHDWPIPSIAVRGAVSRLMGSDQIDLTVASVDVSMSKRFAIQGTVALTPYVGWNMLWIVPRSEVIDKTPDIDVQAMPSDIKMNFVFPDQDNIVRQRIFGGFKLKYYVFALTAEVSYALAGNSVDNSSGSNVPCDTAGAAQNICQAHDKAGSQTSISFSGSIDF